MKLGQKLFKYINALLVLLTLFAYLSPYVNPSITWFFSFFGLGYPILLILNVLFILFWIMVKPKYILISLVCLVLGFKPFNRAVGFNFEKSKSEGLKVMSYNIGHSKYYFKKSDPKQIQNFKNFIEQEAADIICIQERAKVDMEIYDQIFEGYHLFPSEFIGTCIYSKQPILDSGNLYFDTNAHNATWVDVNYKGEQVRIYSIHLSSNKVTNLTDNYKEIWDESKFILNKYNQHAVIRSQQMEKILEHAEASGLACVITGDFNDVPQSYLYRMISKRFDDAFLSQGKGLLKTHNTALPGLRIDYAFHSDELEVLEHGIRKKPYSDHYPLITVFDL